ncbi:MAG: inositol monophosphatase family protein [Pseudohongiellaceae bacterium]|nr:inositol monophosphatase family protein [Pseudohongiellaceae bacterium]
MHESIPEFTLTLARQAGDFILQQRSAMLDGDHRYKDGAELVTEADVKTDEFICDVIRAKFPEHNILAEESAPDGLTLSQMQEPLWIIDPIDGTVNYAHGHLQSAVSIAYAENGQIMCGVVCNPFAQETFHAVKGQGAWLNGKKISVGGQSDLRRSIVATGFPYVKENMAPIVRRLALVLNECADIRRLGAASLDICWVAMGRLDAYYESLSIWDFAAAQLIAQEAGACYGHFKPVPEGVSPVFHNKDILVANSALFEQMKDLLNRASDFDLEQMR